MQAARQLERHLRQKNKTGRQILKGKKKTRQVERHLGQKNKTGRETLKAEGQGM